MNGSVGYVDVEETVAFFTYKKCEGRVGGRSDCIRCATRRCRIAVGAIVAARWLREVLVLNHSVISTAAAICHCNGNAITCYYCSLTGAGRNVPYPPVLETGS